jgi:hypothetical protein
MGWIVVIRGEFHLFPSPSHPGVLFDSCVACNSMPTTSTGTLVL